MYCSPYFARTITSGVTERRHAFILQCLTRLVQSLFQIEFSTEGDLVLLLSISCFLSFPYGRQVATYVFFLVLPSLISLDKSILLAKSKERCTDGKKIQA